MKSRTSFFNSTIIKKDLLRFWPIWSIFFVILQLAFTLNTIFRLQSPLFEPSELQQRSFMMKVIAENMSNDFMMVMIAGIAIITAAAVFGYMNRSRSAYMIHSLPVKRETLFGSHFISGFLMLLVPIFLTWSFLAIINSVNDLGMGIAIVEFFLESTIELIFFYSLSCFVLHLCGNEILSVIVYGVLNCMVAAATWLFNCIHSELTFYGYYGLSSIFLIDDFTEACTPLYSMGMASSIRTSHLSINFDTASNSQIEHYFSTISGFSWKTFGSFAIYLIPAAVFIILAVLLYKKRPLENVGNLLVFKWSVPVFRFVFVFFASILISFVLYIITGEFLKSALTYNGLLTVYIIYIILGVLVSYIVCDMILARSFRIWKKLSVPQMIIIAAVMGILIFLQKAPVKTPVIEDAKAVSALQVTTENNNISFIYRDENEIEQMMQFEKEMADICRKDFKKLKVNEVENGNFYTFQYILKENKDKVIQNYYSVSGNLEEEFLNRFTDHINSPESSINATCLIEGNEKYINHADLSLYASGYSYDVSDNSDPVTKNAVNYDFSSEEMIKKFLEAIRMDIADGNIRLVNIHDDRGFAINPNEYIGDIYISIDDSFFDDSEPISRHYGIFLSINDKCVNILKLLEEF